LITPLIDHQLPGARLIEESGFFLKQIEANALIAAPQIQRSPPLWNRNRNFNVTNLQVARLLKRGIILGWLPRTQQNVPPCSKNLEDGFLASPIE
jgi:hypothetical protein